MGRRVRLAFARRFERKRLACVLQLPGALGELQALKSDG
jgi:hypothetical protein